MQTEKSLDRLWLGGHLATMTTGAAPYGAIRDAAIGVRDGCIAWIGPRVQLPPAVERHAKQVHDLQGAWITPGLIDCHTHVVHAGHRAAEFELRLLGASYAQIAQAGGGIVSTVRQTREASSATLIDTALQRMTQWCAEGATVIEIKSGYGLDLETELRMLRAARALEERAQMTIKTTFLGAHALPQEYAGRADTYIDLVVDEVLPAVAKEDLADAVDAFCEGIGFSVAQTRRVFQAAQALGLPVKLHADQLSDLGGAALAAEFAALSADHIEYSNEAGVRAMAKAGTVAVLLPGAFYFLRETQHPPIEALRKYGVPMAIATDNNPGSSPLVSLLLTMNMACTLFRFTPEEALAGITRHAARALGIEHSHGTLAIGKAADFALWRIDTPAQLAYAIGANPCVGRVRAGRSVPRMIGVPATF